MKNANSSKLARVKLQSFIVIDPVFHAPDPLKKDSKEAMEVIKRDLSLRP